MTTLADMKRRKEQLEHDTKSSHSGFSKAELKLIEMHEHNDSYESEYAGRMYSYCTFCHCCVSEGQAHDDDCMGTEKGLAEALGPKYTKYLAKVEELELVSAEIELELDLRKRMKQSKVGCTTCRKMVNKNQLHEHQRTSTRCNEKRTGLVCYGMEKYTGPKCACCKKPMPDAHPNKRFCSNKGPGNCKDKFNNKATPARRRRARAHASYRNITMEDVWREGGDLPELWDEHKEY